jgi:hypothetical protein
VISQSDRKQPQVILYGELFVIVRLESHGKVNNVKEIKQNRIIEKVTFYPWQHDILGGFSSKLQNVSLSRIRCLC